MQQFAVPWLIANDDELLCLEMSIVSPPFVLDFAARTSTETRRSVMWSYGNGRPKGAEIFGKRWPEVRRAYYSFQAFGILLNDVKPGNVSFPGDNDDDE